MKSESKITSATRIFTYAQYVSMLEDLVKRNATTGEDQSEEKVSATKLNFQRMQRIEKSFTPDTELRDLIAGIEVPVTWVVLTEGWCGDASQNLPVINKIAQISNGNVSLKLVLRDEHPLLMDQFLTNGARAIPKLICINPANQKLLGTWGPRPKTIQQMISDLKAENPTISHKDLMYNLHLFYAKDKGQSLQSELKTVLKECSHNRNNTDNDHELNKSLMSLVI